MKAGRAMARASGFAAAAFENYHAELHRFLRRRVARAQDLDDLVQEVYLRMVRIEKSEMVRNPLAYIYGIASHVASEFHMRERHRRVDFDSMAVDALADNPAHLRPNDSGAFTERQAEEALAQLSANRLAVLLLERRDGLSLEQIAEKLGLSVHTVKKYSVEALAQVRASLER